jgi:xanthine dehydrogenase accessory factor
LHSPIGLSIGAKSAAEIALAIAAEIVAVREGRANATERAVPNVATAPSRADQREIPVR